MTASTRTRSSDSAAPTPHTPPPPPPGLDEATERPKGVELSAPKVLGSALAAGTASIAASQLGVAGTIVGAILGSLVGSVGGEIYSTSLRHATHTVGRARSRFGRGRSATRREELWTRARPRRVILALFAGLAIALVTITAAEVLLGHPLSDSTTSGTSVGTVVRGPEPADPTPAPAPTRSDGGLTPTTDPSPTQSVTGEATPTPEVTPSGEATVAPTPAPTATEAPTPEPSGTAPPATPAGQPTP